VKRREEKRTEEATEMQYSQQLTPTSAEQSRKAAAGANTGAVPGHQ